MGSPLVSVIILNTNRKEDTLAALDSLKKNDYPSLHCIVLDNSSTDGSPEAIEEIYPEVQLVRLEHNLGYAGNNNVGIELALRNGAQWILVLNEDTILAPDCVRFLVEAGLSKPEIGIVGPMIYHFNEPHVIQSAGGSMDALWRASHMGQNELDHNQYPSVHEVSWISGCAIMVRRELVQQIGSIDERFFYYFEETEWCVRARRAGWKIMHVPAAKIWHKGVQRDYQPGPNVTYYATRNQFLLLSKHAAPICVRWSAWFTILKRLVSWSVRPMWRHKRPHRDALAQGIYDYLFKRWGMRKV
jgi:hypothetical protein